MEETKMIKLKDILTERISDIVYHFTTTEAANLIIGNNKFKLQPIPVEMNVEPGKKYQDGYYMSVARTKVEGYTRNTSNFQCYFVRFELDGSKLGNTLKGVLTITGKTNMAKMIMKNTKTGYSHEKNT